MIPDTLLAPDAEDAVIGALLLRPSPELVARVQQILPSAEAFYGAAPREAYRALLDCQAQGMNDPDAVTLRDALIVRGTLALTGGIPYLSHCADCVPSASNAAQHAVIVRDRYLRRQLTTAATSALGQAANLATPIGEALAGTVTQIATVATQQALGATNWAGGLAYGVLEAMEAQRGSEGPSDGIGTGLTDLDTLLGGYAPGRLVVAAARPGVGKSTFALHAAMAAAPHGAVYFLSLEMSEQEVTKRCLGALAQVNFRGLNSGRMLDSDYPKLVTAGGLLKNLPILIDTHSATVAQLRLALAAIQTQQPVSLVIVDYLTLLRSAKRHERRDLEVGAFARDLKMDIARACNVPVLALAQLRRSAHGEAPRDPRLDDLRESGEIEQHADQVVMLHYGGADDGRTFVDDSYEGTKKITGWGAATRTQLLIRKNRHGSLGSISAFYDRTCHRWADWSGR